MALSQAFQSGKRTSHPGATPLPVLFETEGSKDQRALPHDLAMSYFMTLCWFSPGTLNDMAVREFHDCLSKSADVAVAVAAIRALTLVIRFSAAQTIMGLSKELEEAAQALQRYLRTLACCSWRVHGGCMHACMGKLAKPISNCPHSMRPGLTLQPCHSRLGVSSSCGTQRGQVLWS